ncbi:MAG: hypothetical protein LBB09_00905 [Rickettsiales bacterium]|jgi:uncharacterized protein YdcH (DUF465 family)|nr:hypothetical protein [Rickettsiales bacterium]
MAEEKANLSTEASETAHEIYHDYGDDEFKLVKCYNDLNQENRKETLFLEFFQKNNETKLIYYNENNRITLIIDRETMLPKSLRINEGIIYTEVSKNINSVSQEDRAIVEDVVKSKLTFSNGSWGDGDPIIFPLEYLLIEGGYSNIVFDDVDFKILRKKNSLNYNLKKYEEMTDEEKEEKEKILKKAKKDLKKRIYVMLQKRPANSCVIMPYVNFIMEAGQGASPSNIPAHAITLIIRTDKKHDIKNIGVINSDCCVDFLEENNNGERSFFEETYMGLSALFPLKKMYVVPTARERNLSAGNAHNNSTYQGKKSCFFMTKETSGFIQSELNKRKSISRTLKNFSEHGVYRVIDKVKKDMSEPDKSNFILNEEYNDENYNSFTTPSIKKTIEKMKTDGNLNKENIKEMQEKMLVFFYKKAIGLKTVTKRLIAYRRYLKRENIEYAKMFDNCYAKLGKKDIKNDGLKFKKKNYKNKEIKNKLLKKTEFIYNSFGETVQNKTTKEHDL